MTSAHADARSDWEQRIGTASGETEAARAPRLDPPAGLTAVAGRAQVTLSWEPVEGAVGYQVYASDDHASGGMLPLDHHGGDVLAVPHPPYVDTTGEPGRTRWYAVAALSDVAAQGSVGEPVAATPGADGGSGVRLTVDAGADLGPLPRPWRPMIGSEHLSHALSTDTTGGRPIGAELTSALRAARTELGVEAVRAHGILCDDLGVYREVASAGGTEVVHDFTGVDRVYDHVLSLGLVPVVEISFMPRDLASDPSAVVFGYDAVVSPPKDWDRWYDLVHALVAHLVERYGLEQVRDRWSFEVWNEANLEVFWSGTPEEHWRLYDVTAAAVKAVHADLRVGGPASAAAGWVDDLLAHAGSSGAAVDFVSTHTYGSAPLDVRPTLQRHGRADTPIWWTEWGVTPTHFNPVNDSVFSAAFLLHGMASALGRIDSLSYWVVSDHFEELGRPPSLLHGGFGLRTVGELAKPRWWALAMLERLGGIRLPVAYEGDGAGSLVQALAARDDGGGVAVLAWNVTLDQSKADGARELGRHVSIAVDGLEPGTAYSLTEHRVDADHSNVVAAWTALRRDGQDWPDDDQWDALRAGDRLDEAEPPRDLVADTDGRVSLELTLPMPALALLSLTPR